LNVVDNIIIKHITSMRHKYDKKSLYAVN